MKRAIILDNCIMQDGEDCPFFLTGYDKEATQSCACHEDEDYCEWGNDFYDHSAEKGKLFDNCPLELIG